MSGFDITTPPEITPIINDFCGDIVAGEQPAYVAVDPCDGCRVRDCHRNCERFLKSNPGTTIHGWLIWTIPDQWVEAEQHSIIRLPDGSLRDVTPQPDGEEQIVFLPDPKMVYDGTIAPKHVRALVDTPAIQQLMQIARFERKTTSGRHDTMEAMRSATPEQRTQLAAKALSLLTTRVSDRQRMKAERQRKKESRRDRNRRRRANKKRK